ncbi:hypothetical protein DENSPDRAFT_886276 [Dentipellis sp. KUC8613]|nr:hypothetical protein DENSPDRAFT_886276 [Dentipellis sp. KUC8613]
MESLADYVRDLNRQAFYSALAFASAGVFEDYNIVFRWQVALDQNIVKQVSRLVELRDGVTDDFGEDTPAGLLWQESRNLKYSDVDVSWWARSVSSSAEADPALAARYEPFDDEEAYWWRKLVDDPHTRDFPDDGIVDILGIFGERGSPPQTPAPHSPTPAPSPINLITPTPKTTREDGNVIHLEDTDDERSGAPSSPTLRRSGRKGSNTTPAKKGRKRKASASPERDEEGKSGPKGRGRTARRGSKAGRGKSGGTQRGGRKGASEREVAEVQGDDEEMESEDDEHREEDGADGEGKGKGKGKQKVDSSSPLARKGPPGQRLKAYIELPAPVHQRQSKSVASTSAKATASAPASRPASPASPVDRADDRPRRDAPIRQKLEYIIDKLHTIETAVNEIKARDSTKNNMPEAIPVEQATKPKPRRRK